MAISSPCCSHCSSTPVPFTRVPLRLSRSRTRNLPSCPLTRQCFRETEGSTIAIPFDASRPMVTSPSDRGIVESFKGPGKHQESGTQASLTSCPSYHSFRPEINIRTQTVPLSEQIGRLSD